MRLIIARTYELVEYYDSQIPPYAILSHTWGNGEVTFQDMQKLSPETKNSKDGWSKIEKACKIALKYGLDFLWVDTCCIDKTNSVELSEAINSMFQWYTRSEICITYLADITACYANIKETTIFDARWWRRGWTLQELIAPRNLRFYNRKWQDLGSKSRWAKDITQRTGVPIGALQGDLSTTVASAAQKFSWAAGRQTTRPEDEAYCLLGLFDVNMPLLYGEGSRAFQRLQEEIIKQSNDLTIFAHEPENFTGNLFAQKAADFRDKASLRARRTVSRLEFYSTNRGLRMIGEVPIYAGFVSQDRNSLNSEAVCFMLLGEYTTGVYSVLYLTKTGVQIYQRDGGKPLGLFKDIPSTFLGVSQSSDCYILPRGGHESVEGHADTIAGAILLPCIPIPNTIELGPAFEMLPIDLTPHASYDHVRRMFLRRKVAGPARDPWRDVVIAIKGTIQSSGETASKGSLTEIVILCDYSGADPKAFVFESARHPRLEAFLFADVNKENSVVWQLLNIIYPEIQTLSEFLHFRSGQLEYNFNVSFERHERNNINQGYFHLLQIRIKELKD